MGPSLDKDEVPTEPEDRLARIDQAEDNQPDVLVCNQQAPGSNPGRDSVY